MESPPPIGVSPPPTKLTDLNSDLLSHCAGFLSERDVISLALTCKPLSLVAFSDSIWRRLFSERWPSQDISRDQGIREKYLNRYIALNQFRFHDPKNVFIMQHPVPHSHILLNKGEAFLAQGSIVHHTKIKSVKGLFGEYAHRAFEDNILSGHNARITCMRSFPLSETFLSRSEMQNEGNVLVTSSSDRTVRLWLKGRSRRCFKGHSGPVTTLADKLLGNCGVKVLASGGEDCTVRLWSLSSSGKQHPLAMTYHGHEKPISSLSVARHKASLLVSMSTDSRVRVWDANSHSSSSSSCVGMTSVSGPPVGIRCHDTQCYIAAGSSVTTVDLRTMQKVSTPAVLPPKIYSFEMLPSKWLICTGGDDKAMLWDMRKNQAKPEPIAELDSHVGRVTMLHMDPYKIVTGGPSDYYANVWDTGSGTLVNQLDCRVPGENEDGDVAGLSAMAVDGYQIITSGCNDEPGVSYFRDFTDCSRPIKCLDCSSGSKFWDS